MIDMHLIELNYFNLASIQSFFIIHSQNKQNICVLYYTNILDNINVKYNIWVNGI